MKLLVLDAALGRGLAAVWMDDRILAEQVAADSNRDLAAFLPVMAESVLALAGGAEALEAVAVTIGPGSFTGIRAVLALAHGIAAASALPVIGVTVGEALAAMLGELGPRVLWVGIASRPGHLFLERSGDVLSFAIADLPQPETKVAVAGDAAQSLAAWLAARGTNVLLTDARWPSARGIAAAALARLASHLPPREALPLYGEGLRAHAADPRPPLL